MEREAKVGEGMYRAVEARVGGARGWILALGTAPVLMMAVALVAGGGDAPGAGGAEVGIPRLMVGVLAAVAFPGILLAPLFRLKAAGPWDRVSFGLAAYGATLVAHVANVCALRLAGAQVTPGLTLALGLAEGAVAAALWWRRPPAFPPVSRAGVVAVAGAAALVAAWGVGQRGALGRDLAQWWYHAEPMAWSYEGVDEAGARFSPPLGAPGPAEAAGSLSFEVTNPGAEGVDLRLFHLLEGPVGARVRVDCGEAGAGEGIIQRDVTEVAEEGPVPRYQDRGIAAAVLHLELSPGGAARCQRVVTGGDGRSSLMDLSGLPDWRLQEVVAEAGIPLAHYYQILNIVENVRWAEESLYSRWLTINQPPLWSWAYSAVILYAGPHLLGAGLYLCLLLWAVAVVGFAIVRAAQPGASALFMAPVALMALSHGKIILASGSVNFPDNLYALALLSAFYGLASGGAGLYVGAGLAATFLRYPGSTVTILAAAMVAIFDRGRRRQALRAGGMFLGILAAPCLLLALGALMTGQLGDWLGILWFETFPEHFHGEYSLAALLPRPPEFYGLWLKYAGYIPILLLGLRGRLAASAAALAGVYSLFLCFIDHFPSHYFLPLLALTGVAVSASLARWRPLPGRIGLGAACAGLGWWLLWGIP